MVKKVTMFTVICDNCGKDSNEDGEYSCWNDELTAENEATESGWGRDDDTDKHYCPDCFGFDEDDNLFIDESRTIPFVADENDLESIIFDFINSARETQDHVLLTELENLIKKL